MNTYSNGYEDISVEVIDFNMDIARHAWNCYRMTWKELQNVEYNVHDPRCIEALTNIVKMRALPMPREQALMTFRINNISRVCLAQITRQRKAAFNVESQMPRPIEHNVIIPLNLIGTVFEDRAHELINKSQELYDDMINAGIPPQDARYMTLHGQTTSLVYVVDVNTFISSFGFRCENNLSDEINLVYRLCKKAILEAVSDAWGKGKVDDLSRDFYHDIIGPADAAGAKQHIGTNVDHVFGNSFKRYPDANDEIRKITENCDYDFKKSAWFKELQRMNEQHPELLFDGEKEMIESWNS